MFEYNDIPKCQAFLKQIGYSGLFSMEFLRDKNGKDYFMEINMRNDGNSICVTGSRCNLPYIWYNYNCGLQDWLSEKEKKVTPIYCMPEFDDFRNLVKDKTVSLTQWIKDIRKTKRFMEYSPNDRGRFTLNFDSCSSIILMQV